MARQNGCRVNTIKFTLHIYFSRQENVHVYIAPVVCVFGFFNNIANIVVLTRKHMSLKINILLEALAVANLMTIITYIVELIDVSVRKPKR